MIYKTTTTAPSLGVERFFSGISNTIIVRLDSIAYHRRYEPHQIVYFPDDACDYVYWIRSGHIKISRVSDPGREITFRLLFAGDLFGEECLVNSERHNNYAEATTPTLLTLVRSEDFSRLVREEVAFCDAVVRYLCRRTIDTEAVLCELAFAEVRQRIVCRLWHLSNKEEHSGKPVLSITHQEIAHLVGAARETVTSILHALRDEGLIALSNRHIQIVNPSELQRQAGS